jgi:hypothetical protein
MIEKLIEGLRTWNNARREERNRRNRAPSGGVIHLELDGYGKMTINYTGAPIRGEYGK